VKPASQVAEPPRITNQQQLFEFIKQQVPDTDLTKPTKRYGRVVELAERANNPTQDRLFGYQGILFRGDSRPVDQVRAAGGLNGRSDLTIPRNKLEAQGLLISAGAGATGQSGSSMAKEFWGCVTYMTQTQGGPGRIYIVDSRLLPADQAAYDMESNLVGNNYELRNVGAEVNVTLAPMTAIIGWIDVSNADAVINKKGNTSRQAQALLDILEPSHVKLNPAYVAPQT
jgi:hypothetical protein